jgi:uncharacterized protein (DUF433 family)
MSSWEDCRAVERDPTKVSGARVFANTRVPVQALVENLEDGATVDQFIEWFPGVTREQVEAVLVELYRQGQITQHQLGLSLDKSRFEVDELLKRHRVTEDLDTAEQVAEQITILRRLLES